MNTNKEQIVLSCPGSGCNNAVLRIQKGGEMREICGTFTDQELSKQAVVSDGHTEKIQYVKDMSVSILKDWWQLIQCWTLSENVIGSSFGML